MNDLNLSNVTQSVIAEVKAPIAALEAEEVKITAWVIDHKRVATYVAAVLLGVVIGALVF